MYTTFVLSILYRSFTECQAVNGKKERICFAASPVSDFPANNGADEVNGQSTGGELTTREFRAAKTCDPVPSHVLRDPCPPEPWRRRIRFLRTSSRKPDSRRVSLPAITSSFSCSWFRFRSNLTRNSFQEKMYPTGRLRAKSRLRLMLSEKKLILKYTKYILTIEIFRKDAILIR